MSRTLFTILLLVLMAAVAVAADEPPATAGQQKTVTSQAPAPHSDTLLTPQELRTIGPPPPNATAEELERRGDDLRSIKADSDAVDYYNAALLKRPNYAPLYNKLGISELKLAHLKEAKKHFERATKIDKTYAEAFNNLGVVHYMNRSYGKAVKFYKKAIEINGVTASFHSNLGSAYFSRKQVDKAMVEYARALELDPYVFDREARTGVSMRMSSPEDRAYYSYVIARIFAQSGNPDQCLLYLAKAIEEGYSKLKEIQQDQAFAEIRKDPRFTQLMTRAESRPQ